MRLTKDQSRKRYAEMRDLWHKWDPIGVYSISDDWPRDEYDAYLGPTLRRLESGESVQAIEEYLAFVELEYMGLSENDIVKARRRLFALELQEWYETHWAGTHV